MPIWLLLRLTTSVSLGSSVCWQSRGGNWCAFTRQPRSCRKSRGMSVTRSCAEKALRLPNRQGSRKSEPEAWGSRYVQQFGALYEDVGRGGAASRSFRDGSGG